MSLALIRANAPVELNSEQRLAVEHGIGAAEGFSPLLVIAGAGSGKTAMLAHRVAALILAGADPKRIMLATFSRRAAAELIRRVERLLARRLRAGSRGGGHARIRGHLPRHRRAAAARVCAARRARSAIHHPRPRGLRRPDELGPSRGGLSTETKDRFPTKATCLAIYSRVVNARADLGATVVRWFPWVAAHEEALRALFAAYVEAKQRQSVLDYDDLLLWFAQMLSEPEIAAEIVGRFDHLLVDEYQDTNALQAEIVLALRPRGRGPDRRRRRRAVDLFLPRRDGAQHPRFSRRPSSRRRAS